MNIVKYASRYPLALGLAAVLSAGIAVAGAEFSAESIQRGPEGDMSSSKMYVGDKRMRTEMSHQGQQVIRVTDENRGVEWILFPDQKKYMERKLGDPVGQPSGAKSSATDDPCGGMPGLTCRNLGEEDIGGRTAVKWEMVAAHQGQSKKSTQWIDKERGIPLRQEMPDTSGFGAQACRRGRSRWAQGREMGDGRDGAQPAGGTQLSVVRPGARARGAAGVSRWHGQRADEHSCRQAARRAVQHSRGL